MEVVRLDAANVCSPVNLSKVPREITDEDQAHYATIISTQLSPAVVQRLKTPAKTYPRQTEVMALHWHPEFVPLNIVEDRIAATFPNQEMSLIIPTQHNEILTVGDYSGVEVDCYASGFKRKVQLLLHFAADNVKGADKLVSMLNHTRTYRSSQLFDLMDSLIEDTYASRREEAAGKTGADEDTVEFCRIYTRKLKTLLENNWQSTPRDMIKNKLVRNFLDMKREHYGERFISRVQTYVKEVKKLVKADFPLRYFYRATEIIEETRALGGCVVIPHPEQFWPVLLADYDVDGYEVWNPQSQEYTEFLIQVVNRQNESRGRTERPLLVFMGDDCHMGEKVKDLEQQDIAKAAREIGVQPAWEDMAIRKQLVVAGMCRSRVIEEYTGRLG